ncbi:cilia- and flagella-associated protein 251-like [Rhagoletis pomonella]|uniref:cilia- and flagella-associated protein 251-like n=1 Tax=Rhagoletis pomonella TaxID=28610 RepID=UPI00178721A6|nr:cilia- and flagella-associated protein 251-like [Rhagoletis pomonella]
MSHKLLFLAALGIIVYTATPIHAGVLRNNEQPADSPLEVAQPRASNPPESTTNDPPAADSTALSKDQDAMVRIAVAPLDPAPSTVDGIEISLDTVDEEKEESEQKEEEEKQPEAAAKSKDEVNDSKKEFAPALSGDEAASIKVNAHESDDLAKDVPLSNAEYVSNAPSSSKLLLLSTPRLARELEENISEPEDVDINTAVSTDEATELSVEVQTENEKSSEESKESETDKPNFITRVRDALFGKKSADEPTKAADKPDKREEHQKPIADETEKQDKEAVKKENDDVSVPVAAAAAAEQAPETQNNNAATAVLIETEADYVLVDSDVEHLEHLGSFTHADSEEYLQPIVHSVEVVPTHFEEPLLFTSSYVHAW